MDGAELGPDEALDGQPKRCTQTPNLAVAPFGQGDFKRIAPFAEGSHLDSPRPSRAIVQHNPPARDGGGLLGIALDSRDVDALDLSARMGQCMRRGAVVGQE